MGFILRILLGLLVISIGCAIARWLFRFFNRCWPYIRYAADYLTLGRLLSILWRSRKLKEPPKHPQKGTLASRMQESEDSPWAVWGGLRSVIVIAVCLIVVIVTFTYIATRPDHTISDPMWEELFFSIPVFQLIYPASIGEPFSLQAFVELMFFNVLAGLVLPSKPMPTNRPDTSVGDVADRHPWEDEFGLSEFIVAVYSFIYAMFGTCVLFWLPNGWCPSFSEAMDLLLRGFEILSNSFAIMLPLLALFLVLLWAILSSVILLAREFVATFLFSVPIFVVWIAVVSGVQIAVTIPTDIMANGMVILGILAAAVQCYCRDWMDGLFDDIRWKEAFDFAFRKSRG